MGVKVAAKQCESCIFNPENSAIKGRHKRMRQLAQAWERQDTHQICHQFGVGGDDDDLEGEDVVCRGFYDNVHLKNGTGQLLRIAQRLDCIEFVPLPEKGVIDA